MPTAMKRKTSPGPDAQAEPAKRRFTEAAPQGDDTTAPLEATNSAPVEEPSDDLSTPEPSASASASTSTAASDRAARFAALRARNTDSRRLNHKATTAETQRLSTDPSILNSLQRKRDIASEKLLKATTEDAGEDFERKRAWDWTVEESARWDKRLDKKSKHRENAAFQDFSQDASKIYKRQLKEMKPDTDNYERGKMELIERAAKSGGLEIVETEDGELIAVDRDGSFYSTADTTGFVENRPSKEAVDKLVGEIRKAEEVRLRKRRERGKGEDDADVTYINDKNKQFNQKLARFYNKYTADIRESFERGTAI